MGDVVKQNSFRAWILAVRPKTLSGACVPVVVASSLAYADYVFLWHPALLCLMFAILMQIAANFVNDYYDFLRGTDRTDRLGPERACSMGWISPSAMKKAAVIVMIVACGLGLALLQWGQWWFVAVGIACVLFAWLYTVVLSYWGWGDVLVLVFFGVVPVCCTYFAQAGHITINSLFCGLASGWVIDLLLIVNNYRDRDTDKISGKYTLIVRMGERFGRFQYLWTGVLAWACCLPLGINGHVWVVVLTSAFLPFHFIVWRKMVTIRQGKSLNSVLGKTSAGMLLLGALLSIGLLL